MIDDHVFIINPVVHAYNFSEPNMKNRYSWIGREKAWGFHSRWNPEHLQVPKDVFLGDISMEVLARTMFLESRTDMAGNMYLSIQSYYKDGLCSREKNVEAGTRWPQRFFTYIGAAPTRGVDYALNEMNEQKAELPGSIGLKLYPDAVEPYRAFAMDDRKVAFPLFERAREMGLKTVGIHKAIPNGPVPLAPYRVDDVEVAAEAFPELAFEIIHAGIAFTEETALAIARFPNVYANLELTTLYLFHMPGVFDEVMAQFLKWGGPEKIIYSDGAPATHPQPLLEKFWSWELPEHLLRKYNLKQVTKRDKALMLGGNYARIVGLDIERAKARIADDEFSRAVGKDGLRPVFSTWMDDARKRGLVAQ